MPKFRKKPVVIEAYQVKNCKEKLPEDAPEWAKEAAFLAVPFPNSPAILSVETLEGTMRAGDDDWLIQGVNGEVYPCKPDIFEKTYEPVREEQP